MGIEFTIEKWAIVIMEGRKREWIEGLGLPNQERLKVLGEKKNHKNLDMLTASNKQRWKKKSTSEKENFSK